MHSLESLTCLNRVCVWGMQTRKAGAKLELYRRFTNTLAIMVWISVGWIAYEMYFKVTDQYNEKWQFDWITNDFWHILNFVFLSIICFLWAPSAAATRYAYSELEGTSSSPHRFIHGYASPGSASFFMCWQEPTRCGNIHWYFWYLSSEPIKHCSF